jgi:Cd2+/Zn2+-exporting ATPase
MLVFEDTIRPESQSMLQSLQAMGLRTILLTGDHQHTAERVTQRLSIREE